MKQPIDEEKKACIGLSYFEGIGPVRFRLLKNYFGSASAVYNATKSELLKTNVGTKLVDQLVRFRNTINLDNCIAHIKTQGIVVVTDQDYPYPPQLVGIESAPFILYARGNVNLLSERLSMAIVGTRKPTNYGISCARQFAEDLSNAGFTIVSGMALGIDTEAHKATLSVAGKTIAVLGCGVDICYPASNYDLYKRIIQQGVVISEFPPGQRTSKGVFPSRNRIIAGLSSGTLLVEGANRSGSLITASYAGEYGRDVFAIPGPITSPLSAAPHALIRQGALLVTSINDIVAEYKDIHVDAMNKKKVETLRNLSVHEQAIITHIQEEGSVHIDMLARQFGSSSQVFALISQLEVRGIVQEKEAGVYIITP